METLEEPGGWVSQRGPGRAQSGLQVPNSRAAIYTNTRCKVPVEANRQGTQAGARS